jgi:hypothetical protein
MFEIKKEQLRNLLNQKAQTKPDSPKYFELINKYNNTLSDLIDEGLDEPIEDDLLLDDYLIDNKYLDFEKKWRQEHPYTIKNFIDEQCFYICLVEIREVKSHTARAKVLHSYKGGLAGEIKINFFIPWGREKWFEAKEKSFVFLDGDLISLGLLGRMPLVERDGAEYAASYAEESSFWPDDVQVREGVVNGEKLFLIQRIAVENIISEDSLLNTYFEEAVPGALLARVILDSGCFLTTPERGFAEIGYFQSSRNFPDIKVRVDGYDVNFSEPMHLGKKSKIEIRHVRNDGTIEREGTKRSRDFHEKLLHLKDLYGEDISVDRTKFDCIIQFNSGRFAAAMVKPRLFKKRTNQAVKQSAVLPDDKPKLVKKSIPQTVYVHFKLDEGEALEFARDGKVFWSSRGTDAKKRLDIEIVADNATAEKFYCLALKGARDSYWLPNEGDPPPMCSVPPCEPSEPKKRK